MKLLTLEDYEKAGESFWPKYWYVAKELGENATAEDILKVLESIGTVKYSPFQTYRPLSTAFRRSWSSVIFHPSLSKKQK